MVSEKDVYQHEASKIREHADSLRNAADSLKQIFNECRAVRKNVAWLIALELAEEAALHQARQHDWLAGVMEKAAKAKEAEA